MSTVPALGPRRFVGELASRVGRGQRLAALLASGSPDDGVRLSAVVAWPGGLDLLDAEMAPGTASYPSVTRVVPAAFWYEREIHDLFGVVPEGHPRLDPLVWPLRPDLPDRPFPGRPGGPRRLEPDEREIPRYVTGPGVFTIPHGPVRSGVFESVEYLVETPGEDVPHVQIRPFHKHRGLEKRFEGMTPAAGVLLAERVEGVASVAHALAYAHAVESLAGGQVPPAAQLVRVLHAELERVANHLDVVLRLAEAAGLAVAQARFGLHKERVLRLVGRLCGSRFGRGVVMPGGVAALPTLAAAALLGELGRIEQGVRGDRRALMVTASFLDRLRTTGPLSVERAREHRALGPVGRASGAGQDVRWSRPYDTYRRIGAPAPIGDEQGDALARLDVRWAEVDESFRLLRLVTDELDGLGSDAPVRLPLAAADGRAVGDAEAPPGEVLYLVEVADGRIVRCKPRSASFHNLHLFSAVFAGDILTDFPFIEASFGLSIAGVVS